MTHSRPLPDRPWQNAVLAGIVLLLGAPAFAQAPAGAPFNEGHRAIHHPRHARHHATPKQDASLHLPPRPALPPAVGAAPVPDETVVPPADRAQPQTNLQPSIFQLHYPSSGDGYVAGSSPQTSDNEHAAQIGGVQLQVPLH